MRAVEFITEAAKPIAVPAPDAVDPNTVTDPNKPAELVNKIADVANMPIPSVKENKKIKKKK